MRIQHQLGADIIFAFDDAKTDGEYLGLSTAVGGPDAAVGRSLPRRTPALDPEGKPAHDQALFAVVQGAHTRICGDGRLVILCRWPSRGQGSMATASAARCRRKTSGRSSAGSGGELPENKACHLLGISEPDDIFTAIENGVDTDCVAPSRVACNAAVYTVRGRFNVNAAGSRWNFGLIDQDCDCYTCTQYTQAYLHHLFKAWEMLAPTLCTIHNERFVVRLVDDIRARHRGRTFSDFRIDFFDPLLRVAFTPALVGATASTADLYAALTTWPMLSTTSAGCSK